MMVGDAVSPAGLSPGRDLPAYRVGIRPRQLTRTHHHAYGRFGIAEAYFRRTRIDRKSTRLNSSHRTISYAVFCLKKKSYLPPRSNNRAGARSHATLPRY